MAPSTARPSVGFIGAGKVGCALGRYFRMNGIPVSGYASRTFAHARNAAIATDSEAFAGIEALEAACDAVFVTTDDASIPAVWERIRAGIGAARVVCHCSGALPASVFDGAREAGFAACSCHPLFSFTPDCDPARIAQAVFAVEGDDKAVRTVTGMIEACGNTVVRIDAHDKTSYHAAAACASNLVCALVESAERTLVECGFSREAAHRGISALFSNVSANIVDRGCAAALTGPIERNDASTVASHLRVLEGENAQAYRSLSRILVSMAQELHPTRDYTQINAMLASH